ncbi:MAG: iron-sulfur cluster repair di-iron protein [Saprospirales bacterium]|nr:MAG: iron-sulfur cluster repair di-iron protein [Saprospirales bacterium]
MKNQNFDISVGELVADDYRRADVLGGYEIDYSCGGTVTLEEACKERGLNPAEIWVELLKVSEFEPYIDYKSFGPTKLIQHVVDVHHEYVRNSVIPLRAYLEKLLRTEGDKHPELPEVRELFFQLCDHLFKHMEKEEMILFPYLKAMYGAMDRGYPLSMPYFSHVDIPICELEDNHRTQMDSFDKIRRLSRNFSTHNHSSRTFKVAYAMLDEFGQNLRLHIHLENNIIFPEARKAFEEFALRPH